jgi:hypothetical protein
MCRVFYARIGRCALICNAILFRPIRQKSLYCERDLHKHPGLLVWLFVFSSNAALIRVAEQMVFDACDRINRFQ